ncbi:hypothetical protein RN001_012922 [Aquatica leii]|uniref:Hexamerin n=1 Tax=Aquatica leii TaxID=1421715 RepID=A0AAN7PR12_9COLE|nr:hypothetical protein RN001_012922 [Aquatica leii]
MHLQQVLCVFFITCVLSALGKTLAEQAEFGEGIIKKEIERFNVIKDKIFAKHVNVIAEFSYSQVGEDDNLLHRESFELRPLATLKPEKVDDSDGFERDALKLIFDLAKKYNISAAASRETFDENGGLLSKTVYTDFLKIHFDDGNTEIKIRDDPSEGDEDDDEVEELIGFLKEFELPVKAEKKIFDRNGELVKNEETSYLPKRVRIESVSGMSVDMQMKVTEALKRTCVMKEHGIDRIKLLVRYLGIQFPEYSFEAVIGDGFHYVENDVNVKEQTEFSKEIIKKEIERFNTIKDKIFAKHVNVIAEFSHSKVGEDQNLLQRESFQLRPLATLKPEKVGDSNGFDRDAVKLIFDLAKKYNISAAASREKFDENGGLLSKTVYADFVKIHFENGNTEIKIRDDPSEGDEDDVEVEDVIRFLKQYDLPVEAEKRIFDRNEELVKHEVSIYEPQHVRIESVGGMAVDMQIKISDALKRACVLEDHDVDRIKLLVKNLEIQFPEYNFEAVMGDGLHYVENDVNIKMKYFGSTYFVWGTIKVEEE